MVVPVNARRLNRRKERNGLSRAGGGGHLTYIGAQSQGKQSLDGDKAKAGQGSER